MVIEAGKACASFEPIPSSVQPSQPVVTKVWPKIVVVPTPSAGEPIASTRRAGSLLSEASRFGEALKICRPLPMSTKNARTQSQWLRANEQRIAIDARPAAFISLAFISL